LSNGEIAVMLADGFSQTAFPIKPTLLVELVVRFGPPEQSGGPIVR